MSSSEPAENFMIFEAAAVRLGIDVVSSAKLSRDFKETFHPGIREIASSLDYALVLGIRLSESILETVQDAPTWTYYHHYRTVNSALDQAALYIAGEVQRLGHRGLPIPASQVLDWDRLRGHLSHQEIGALAGIGWWGRNNLLVHPRYGSQVRYTTVLTDVPLPAGGAGCAQAAAGFAPAGAGGGHGAAGRVPAGEPGRVVTDETGRPPGDCGDCYRCVDVCPVGAIQDSPRNFRLDRCAAQLRRFSRNEKLNVLICGICVRACGGKDWYRHRS